jgi:hypothetical protein
MSLPSFQELTALGLLLCLHALDELLATDRSDTTAAPAFRANPLARRQAHFDPARRLTQSCSASV